jgi:predicted acyl esterase
MGEQVTFWSEPLKEEIEITGPSAAKLFIAPSTKDADVFVTLRAFAPNGREVLFAGAVDPNAPLSHGWLRASHRKLDPKMSLFYRAWRAHDEEQPLIPGETYELDVEIWPTSIVLKKGYRLAFTMHGKDFDHGLPEPMPKLYGLPMRGCSVFLHDDPTDRDPAIHDGMTTIRTGGDRKSYVLLPVIPAQ